MNSAIQRALALILAFGCILSTGVFATTDEAISLDVEEGRIASEAAVIAQDALDSYFQARNSATNNLSGVAQINSPSASESLGADASMRARSLHEYWANEDVEIMSTSTTQRVISAAQTVRNGNIDAIVYEWTWMDYIDGDSSMTDRMGFATVHDMTLTPDEDGMYAVSRDSYDEWDISGHTSKDYNEVEFAQAVEGIDTMPLFREITSNDSFMPTNEWPDIAPRALAGNATNILDSIDYADKWVIHDIANDYDSHTANYNESVYGTSSGNDCCNYVSQCLAAGGLQMNSTWSHPKDGTTNCTSAWQSVNSFTTYWGKTYTQAASSAGVIPGNPVYYFSSSGNHIAICVGYNTAGNPIINGHTRDVYHQKMDSIYTYTMKFNTVSPFITKPQNGANIPVPGSVNTPYIQAGKAEWFKITPSSSKSYTIYSTGSTDTKGILYEVSRQGSHSGSAGISYLFELAADDDSGTGSNFSMTQSLSANKTYYLMVRGYGPTTTGNYGVSVS